MTERAWGSGTVYRDEKRRRWVAAVDIESADGKRRRKRMIAHTQEDADALLAAWNAEHPVAHLGRASYLAAARAQGTHTDSEWWALVRKMERRCFYCGVETLSYLAEPTNPRYLQRDHKIPVSRGGSDAIDNIVVSCRACNAAKRGLTADEFLARRA